ncbi:hypothetical protein FRC12_020870 [Ceratobasidium sp. 428]|nr:hypothetical protein FRC12_020870 [Ceratobasidium sp. 428]
MDTVITALTVFKTARFLSQEHGRVRLVHVILRDGLLYFAVILVANLSNCLAYYLAPPDLKVIGASFSNIITIMMISRLQLNLRSDSICSPDISDTVLSLPYGAERKGESSGTSTFTSSLSQFFRDTVTELGKEIGEEIVGGKAEPRPSAQSRSVVDVGPAREIEMLPIQPIGGDIGEVGVPDHDVLTFNPEEVKRLGYHL